MRILFTCPRQHFFVGMAIMIFMLMASASAQAQIALPTASPYTQDFNIGTSATAPLPANWRVDKQTVVRTLGTFAAAATATELRAGDNMITTAQNGIYNYGDGDPTTATDRAVGWVSSGTATKSGNLYAQFINSTGTNISSVEISYNVEKYRNGSNPAGFTIQMYYSFDGVTWTSAGGSFATSFPADANNNGFPDAPGATVAINDQVLNVTIPSGSNFYLAWNYSVTTGTITTNAQALSIDDFSILVNTTEITPDAPSSNSAFDGITGVMSLMWSHTVGSGSSRILIVGVSTSTTSIPPVPPTDRVGSVTYGSTPLTRIGTQVAPDNRSAIEMFQLTNPASGTDTITVNILAAGVNYVVGGAMSFAGVSGTGPFTSSAGTSDSPTVAVVSQAGELVIDTVAIAPEGLFLTPGANQTERWNGFNSPCCSTSFSVGGGSTEPGAASVIMSWAATVAQPWAIGAVALKPVGPTAVELASFNATQIDKGVWLEWQTGYEVDNLGFNIYREVAGKRTRITRQLVAGSALLAGAKTALTAGASYGWLDDQVDNNAFAQYWLEDVDLNGKTTLHGPISPLPGSKLSSKAQSVSLARLRYAAPATGQQQLLPHREPSSVDRKSSLFFAQSSQGSLKKQWEIAARSAVKISIRKDGWYRINQPELVAAGFDASSDPRFLQLYVDGEEAPLLIKGGTRGRLESTDAIEFYATALDNASTDTRAYWLVAGTQAGRRINQVTSSNGKETSAQSFFTTVERKERTVYFAGLKNGDAENFFGQIITTDPVAQTIAIRNLYNESADEVALEVALQGVTDLPDSAFDHSVKVIINGIEAGTITFDGQEHKIARLMISSKHLREGDNVVTLQAGAGEMDVSLLDYVRLTYPHTFKAEDNSLRFTAVGGETLRVGGFSDSRIRVLDITDPNNVQEVRAAVEPSGNEFAIKVTPPESGPRTLIAFDEKQVNSAHRIEANRRSTWNHASNKADLVVITEPRFLNSIAPLKSLRQNQGLKVAVAFVEDIYDEFSYGARSPQALRDFLSRAKTNWKKPPRFVLLIGDASFDPRNHLGSGDWDFVPTKFIATSKLETASDDWFADFDDNGVAEMAVGRLPVRTEQEADLVISKITSYDRAAGAEGVLMIADRNDGFDFEAASKRAREAVGDGVAVQEIFRGRTDDPSARQQVMEGMNRGPKLVNYIGHGSVDLWRGNLFTAADAAALANETGLSLVITMTCLNGYFQDPVLDGLAEALLKAERGGAVAVWASSALTLPTGQASMNKELIRQLMNGAGSNAQAVTLGEATAKAKSIVSNMDVRRSWILFGDPSMRIR